MGNKKILFTSSYIVSVWTTVKKYKIKYIEKKSSKLYIYIYILKKKK
jgi:hypothetical protein